MVLSAVADEDMPGMKSTPTHVVTGCAVSSCLSFDGIGAKIYTAPAAAAAADAGRWCWLDGSVVS